MKFLFWNTNGRDLHASLGRLAASHRPDLVILAENRSAVAPMEFALSAATGRAFQHVVNPGCLVRLYSGLGAGNPKVVVPSSRFSICLLNTPNHGAVLMTVAHLPSKLRFSQSTQRVVASDLAEEIRGQERKRHITCSFLIGDLNMNPFDPGMIEADALHAVNSRKVAGSLPRPVNGKYYPMFYNPCWSFMGDGSGVRPPGTFHRKTSDNDCIFFHVIDQVLLRPDLIGMFPTAGLQVLESDGVDSLVSARDVPRKAKFSDHLPILLELQL